MIDSETKVAFIVDPTRKLSPEHFAREMPRVFPSVTYRKSTACFYTVYSDFDHLPRVNDVQGDPDTITAEASRSPHLVFTRQDRVLINRWHTDDKQQAGMFPDVFLAYEQAITRINLYDNTHHRGQAKKRHMFAEKDGAMIRLKVLAEKDGKLVLQKQGVERNACFIERKNGHPVVGDVNQEIHLPLTRAARLGLEITEPDGDVEWSVGEIKLFRLKDNE